MTSALDANCKGKLAEGSQQRAARGDVYVLQRLRLLCSERTGQGRAPRTQEDPSGGSCTGIPGTSRRWRRVSAAEMERGEGIRGIFWKTSQAHWFVRRK